MTNRLISAILLAFVILWTASCSKEERKSQMSRQESNIETFINGMLAKVDTAYVVRNRGVDRLVIVPGEGDSLDVSGTVSFRYAGYVMNSSSLNNANIFATNSPDVAESVGWEVSDTTAFDIKTLNIGDDDLVEGLKRGLEGTKGGQECYILFSGKYGFGKKTLGTIPANAALAYHVWVESITNE
ncbi:MAG: FKBP-type peptidyl-prolyl cis-trans isomerase [Candidatus Cryptobacteroides sp.]